MPTITVRVRDVYGVPTIYPVCNAAKSFAAIAGTKSLTLKALQGVVALGYTIVVDGGNYAIGPTIHGSLCLVEADTPHCCDPRFETFWST